MNSSLGLFAAASVGWLVYDITGEPREGIVAALSVSLFAMLLAEQFDRIGQKIENLI